MNRFPNLDRKEVIHMKTRLLSCAALALMLAVAGLVYARQAPGKAAQPGAGYVCPATGDVLPCPNCCPLKQ